MTASGYLFRPMDEEDARAIRVYERASLRRVKVFTQHTNGGEHPSC